MRMNLISKIDALGALLAHRGRGSVDREGTTSPSSGASLDASGDSED